MSEAYRRFKLLRREPEWPIFIRNVTDEMIEINFPCEGDFKFWQSHPLKAKRKHLRIPPGQLIDLRYFISEEPLHTNMHLPWYLETGRLRVENEACWNCDWAEKCPTLKSLYRESRVITRMANDRWRAVMATRSKQ